LYQCLEALNHRMGRLTNETRRGTRRQVKFAEPTISWALANTKAKRDRPSPTLVPALAALANLATTAYRKSGAKIYFGESSKTYKRLATSTYTSLH
jgi:hypothetical protein